MSDKKCRFVKANSILQLSTEYSVKKIETEIVGNPDWIKVIKVDVKKWYRNLRDEVRNSGADGEVPRVIAYYAQIVGRDLISAIQHWLDTLVNSGQFLELGDLPNCPEAFKQKVVLIVGDDSGQNHTR